MPSPVVRSSEGCVRDALHRSAPPGRQDRQPPKCGQSFSPPAVGSVQRWPNDSAACAVPDEIAGFATGFDDPGHHHCLESRDGLPLERSALISPDIAIRLSRAAMIEHGLRGSHVPARCPIVLDGDAAPEHPGVEARQGDPRLSGLSAFHPSIRRFARSTNRAIAVSRVVRWMTLTSRPGLRIRNSRSFSPAGARAASDAVIFSTLSMRLGAA